MKTSEPDVEISVSPVTLEVEEVQPSTHCLIDSEEDNDDEGEVINTINSMRKRCISTTMHKAIVRQLYLVIIGLIFKLFNN